MSVLAAWLGIDWADQKHRWAMRLKRRDAIHQGELEHTPEAIEQFVSGLAPALSLPAISLDSGDSKQKFDNNKLVGQADMISQEV